MIEPVSVSLPQGKGDPGSAVKQFVKAGDVCVDVGANIGTVTYPMRQRAGDSGKVYAIEPNPSCLVSLRDLASKNPTILVHPCAAAERSGTGSFWAPANHEQGSIEPEAIVAETITRHIVEYRRLDDLIPKSESVAFVKIDVQGSECHVLDGAPRILAQCPTWFIECWNFGLTARQRSVFELYEQLRSVGLQTYWTNGMPFGLSDLRAWVDRSRPHQMVNIVARR